MAIAQYCLFSIILISSGVFARDPEEYYNAVSAITKTIFIIYIYIYIYIYIIERLQHVMT